MPRSRPPTYGTATRVARIVFGLIGRPRGWSFPAIGEELGISERTLLRYLAACRRELVDATGKPLLETIRRGGQRYLVLSEAAHAPDSTAWQALSFYFALTVLRFLEGTVLRDGAGDLWNRFVATLGPAQRRRLSDFDRKFFTVPYAPKDYRDADDVLDTALRALVDQHTLRVEYAGLWHGDSVQEFDPYTLAYYRGGLYLIGRSHKHRRVVYLAVERIRRASALATRFEYPRRYSPAQHTEGTFGIVDGPKTHVELLLHTPQTAALLRARQLHPTQRFVMRADGRTVLSMTVHGTRELANWVLGQAPYVEVLSPVSLREEIAAVHASALAHYRAQPRRQGALPRAARRAVEE